MKIGFFGLGEMGRPIVAHLAAAGYEVTAFARRPQSLAGLAEFGVGTTLDRANFATSDVLFLCLSDGAAVHDLLFDDQAAVPLAGGALVVDLTTHDRSTALEMSRRLAEADVRYVDAPISGMARRAVDAELTVMCGADVGDFARAEPMLRTFASEILHLGAVGSGQAAKLINQLLFDVNAAVLAELMPVAVDLGLPPELVERLVNSGTGRSYASEFFLPRILDGRFDEGYPLERAYKDIKAGAVLSSEGRYPMPLVAAASTTYQLALRSGHGGNGKGAMIRFFEDLIGQPFRRTEAASAHGGTPQEEGLTIYSSLAFEGALREVVGAFPEAEQETIRITFAPTGKLLERLAEGPLPDLAFLTEKAANDLFDRQAASEVVPIARSRIGVAMRRPDALPVLRDSRDLAAFLREVRSITYSRSGASGIFFRELMERLELRDVVDPKATVIESGLTAQNVVDGTTECALQQVSELRMVTGAACIRPLPEDCQQIGLFSAAIFKPSTATAEFVERFRSADARQTQTDWGLEPVAKENAA